MRNGVEDYKIIKERIKDKKKIFGSHISMRNYAESWLIKKFRCDTAYLRVLCAL